MKRGKDIPDNLAHGWDQELQGSRVAAVLCAGPQQTPHPTENPKYSAHCNHSLLTGILGNSADFGSRGHGNVWVLLVEINILRKKIPTEGSQLLESNLKTAIWKQQFENMYKSFSWNFSGPACRTCMVSCLAAPAPPRLKTDTALLN